MAAIRITVGAALDPSALAVFQPLIAAAGRARGKIAAESKATATDIARDYRSAPAHAKKSYDEQAQAAEDSANKRISSARKVAAEERRILNRMQADQVAGYRREAQAAVQAGNRRAQVAIGAGRNFGSIARAGTGVAGRIAGGAGVKLDAGAHIEATVENEAKLIGILNQVKLAGQKAPVGGLAGLQGFARDTANKSGQSTGGVIDALAEFQAKSSDLKTGQEVMADLGKLALAAGADFKDVGSAAAFINAQLDETPDRGKKLLGIMRAITAQTAEGQVELKDWAKYMPRIAAAANAFSGDYSKNIGMLSALAQISVKGGRSTAAEASGSAAALSRDLRKGQTMKAFAKEGVDVFQDKGKTKLRPVEDIIFQSIEKTKGNQAKLAAMWKNVVSSAPVMALAQKYTAAGGGKAGMAAARAEVARFDKSVSAGDVEGMSASAMTSNKVKVQLFNNELERIAAETLPKLVKPMEQLAPLVAQAAQGFASLVAWTATNPGKAVALALGASVAKEVATIGLGNMIAKMLSGAGGGKVGLALGAATLAIGVATLIVSSMESKTAAGEERAAGAVDLTHKTSLKAAKEFKTSGSLSQETISELARAKADIAEQKAAAERAKEGTAGRMYDVATGKKTVADVAAENEYRSRLPQIEQQEANIDALLAKAGVKTSELTAAAVSKGIGELAGKTLRVNVVNLPDGGLAGGAPGAQTGPQPIR